MHRLQRIRLMVIWMFLATNAQSQNSEIQLLPPPDRISEDFVGENVFLEQEPSWFTPASWFSCEIWECNMEIGINGSEGNAQALSLLTAAKMKRETDASTIALDATYGKTRSGDVETQHYALVNSRWDWKISPAWLFYNKNTIEYDEFKAFDIRLSATGGLGHHFLKSDVTTLSGRMGAGVSREFGGPDEDWVPEANCGWDFEHKISERQKINFVSDYFPSWEDFANYRLVTKADWEILLDEETNLSLKIGAIDRYDSTPNGAKHNDIDYYLTLLWKL